jgi:hypothetical protein
MAQTHGNWNQHSKGANTKSDAGWFLVDESQFYYFANFLAKIQDS